MTRFSEMLILVGVLFSIPKYAGGQNDTITTFAGSGNVGFSGDGGLAINADIGNVVYGAFDKEGNYFFATRILHRVRKVSQDGIITTFAGNGNGGFSGDGGDALNAELDNPTGVAIDDSGNVYISDLGNNRIRRVSINTGIITTVVGNGIATYSGDGGLAINASIYSPCGIAFDKNRALYIADQSNHCIRKIDSFGIITTIAGTGVPGYNGDNQQAISAQLSGPVAVCIDSIGNIYLSDWGNYKLRKVDITTGFISLIAGGSGTGLYNGDEIPAISAGLAPRGLVINKEGQLFVSDASHRVRMIDLNDTIYTIAGTGVQGYNGDGGPALSAQLNNPEGLSLDSCGNLYVCVSLNRRIRKIKLAECEPVYSETINKQTQVINIYPNPAYSQVTITANSQLKEAIIRNAIGQVAIQLNINKEKAEINIAHLSPGIYFVTVIDANGEKVVKKIVKE